MAEKLLFGFSGPDRESIAGAAIELELVPLTLWRAFWFSPVRNEFRATYGVPLVNRKRGTYRSRAFAKRNLAHRRPPGLDRPAIAANRAKIAESVANLHRLGADPYPVDRPARPYDRGAGAESNMWRRM